PSYRLEGELRSFDGHLYAVLRDHALDDGEKPRGRLGRDNDAAHEFRERDLDRHAGFVDFGIKFLIEAIDDDADFFFVFIRLHFIREHVRVRRDLQFRVAPVLHVADLGDRDVVRKLGRLDGVAQLRDGRRYGERRRRAPVNAPHRHAVIETRMPAIEKHPLAQALLEVIEGGADLVRLVGLFDGLLDRLRERALELVLELVAAGEEKRLVVDEVDEFRGVEVLPQHRVFLQAGVRARFPLDEHKHPLSLLEQDRFMLEAGSCASQTSLTVRTGPADNASTRVRKPVVFLERSHGRSSVSRLFVGPDRRRIRRHGAAPNMAPTSAVNAIASAPQKVTRNVPSAIGAPPARAANAPRIARNTSEVPATKAARCVEGTRTTVNSGKAAPAAKVVADAIAA